MIILEPTNVDDASVDPPRPRGRPRDPHLEDRALQAALDVFGEKGWVGLTIDEVAARARVGKSSIYLRWRDKETLLAAALRQIQQRRRDDRDLADPGAGPDRLTLREYLIDHATRRAELYLAPDGLAMFRLYVETRAFPEVFAEIRQEAITDFVFEERRRVQAAIDLGDLPAHASAVQILDAIEGSVLVHVLVTPPQLVDRVRANLPVYVEAMVDNQLRAAAS